MMNYCKRLISLSLLFIAFSTVPVASYAADQPASTDTIEAPVTSAVNINRASAEEIAASLKGIGLKKAQAIVEWRKNHGHFSSVEQLLSVKGIGEKIILKNKDQISL